MRKVPPTDQLANSTIKRNISARHGSTAPCVICTFSFYLRLIAITLVPRLTSTDFRVSLVHDSGDLLLSEELLEGSLECVLWANLVDLLIVDVLVARRYVLFDQPPAQFSLITIPPQSRRIPAGI